MRIRLINHYLLLSVVTIITVYFLRFLWPKLDAITFITTVTGYIALVLFVIVLVSGTFNFFFKNVNLLANQFRRDIGIFSGIMAVIHSVTGLFVHLRGYAWKYFLQKSENGFSIRLDEFGLANYLGLISALIILVLLITSNDFSIKLLGYSSWKNIQRLTYLMFLLVLAHSYYYILMSKNLERIFYFYLPLICIVLIFQIIGICQKKKCVKI